VPTITALCVLGSCYGQLAVGLAARRQNGILKRVRATPLPAWGYFTGLLAHCVLVSLADIVLIVGVARLYGVPFPSQWPAIALTLVLGAASFCALGVAVASVISNAEAAPAVTQLVLFPLLFLSGTYMPISSQLLNRVTSWLPVRPCNEALTGPLSRHTGADWRHLAVLAAWGVIGATAAVRRSGGSAGTQGQSEPGRPSQALAAAATVARARGWLAGRPGRTSSPRFKPDHSGFSQACAGRQRR
jgi:ABC-2 type transport system permease protein